MPIRCSMRAGSGPFGQTNATVAASPLDSGAGLREELRLRTGTDDLARIDAAWRERSGRLGIKQETARAPERPGKCLEPDTETPFTDVHFADGQWRA